MIRDFNEVSPGLGTRLIDAFITQSEHRIWAEKTTINSNINRSWAGLVCAFVLTAGFLACGTWVALTKSPEFGAAIATVPVVGLVGAFITGTISNKSERIEKAKIMSGKKK